MNNHVTRMTEEKLDLDDKLRKLTAFIVDDRPDAVFPTLDEIDRQLLERQRNVMHTYAGILRQRLDRAGQLRA